MIKIDVSPRFKEEYPDGIFEEIPEYEQEYIRESLIDKNILPYGKLSIQYDNESNVWISF